MVEKRKIRFLSLSKVDESVIMAAREYTYHHFCKIIVRDMNGNNSPRSKGSCRVELGRQGHSYSICQCNLLKHKYLQF